VPSSIAYELARLNTDIEQLKAEKAQLEAENDRLRELLAAKHESLLAGEAFAVVPGR
jgi:cell shape-determining protein MreC